MCVSVAMALGGNAQASPLEMWRMLRDGRGTPEQYQSFLKKHADWPDKAGLVAAGEKAILSRPMVPKRDVAWFSLNPPTTSSGHMRYVEALSAIKHKNLHNAVRNAWRFGISPSDEEKFHLRWSKYRDQQDNHIASQDDKERFFRLMMQGVEFSPIATKRQTTLYTSATNYIAIKSLLKNRRYSEAESMLRNTLPISGPVDVSNEWWKIRHAVARECIERKDYHAALEFVVDHGLPEGTEDWATAEWTRGWLLWHTNQFEEAYRAFTHVFNKVKSPVSRSRMAFWAAESARGAHMEERTVEWHQKSAQYGLTFYGQLSARCLKKPVEDMFWANQASPDASIKKDDLYHIITGKEELSKEEKLLFFSAWVKRLQRARDPNDPIFVYAVQLAKQKGGDSLAVAMMRLVNFASPKLVRLAFPKLRGVSGDIAALANAIAWRESGFDSQIVSSAGAVGLMQMMPGTFEKEKRKMSGPVPVGTVRTPAANVAVGTFLIRRLMQEYQHTVLVLCSYNAGEEPVKRWCEVFGQPPSMEADPIAIADWIEKIPYQETRNYVQRVLEKVYTYHLVG